jgi:hypothetical protein
LTGFKKNNFGHFENKMFNRRIEDNPFRSLRLSVRTAASHVAKAGSTPAGITKFEMRQRQSKRGANGAA